MAKVPDVSDAKRAATQARGRSSLADSRTDNLAEWADIFVLPIQANFLHLEPVCAFQRPFLTFSPIARGDNTCQHKNKK